VLVATSPPTAAAADDSCATAPALVPNTTTPFNLANHDDDIVDDCFEANPDAAYGLALSAPSE